MTKKSIKKSSKKHNRRPIPKRQSPEPGAAPHQPTQEPTNAAASTAQQTGFTILELLIVVAIIALLAGLALPKLLTARQTAIENGGAAATRSIVTAVASYQAKYGVWPPTMAALGGTTCATAAPTATAACLLDDTLAQNGLTNQYQFLFSTSGSDFTVSGDPIANSPAKRHFYADSNLTVRYNDGAAATATSTPLGQ